MWWCHSILLWFLITNNYKCQYFWRGAAFSFNKMFFCRLLPYSPIFPSNFHELWCTFCCQKFHTYWELHFCVSWLVTLGNHVITTLFRMLYHVIITLLGMLYHVITLLGMLYHVITLLGMLYHVIITIPCYCNSFMNVIPCYCNSLRNAFMPCYGLFWTDTLYPDLQWLLMWALLFVEIPM